ncbi:MULTISPECIES: MarR family winged helix-turn-helix transcriptional regulator [Bacillus]|uniref:MarR family transcriptional regulator n=1 Tax=Bacillus anthracis TaxID=1392 RepID=A0A0J1HKJ6_BACAN|nr:MULTISPECIES: MarR family transcriptional regulator [Bacillus cereus group]OUA68025.1 MarR family transcriptional regulator [Bacillus thuringiensis serovar thailandensis]QXW42447.1 MarR family transcriptional regulator [Klebsiella grimontii]KLV14273.1 MarR family transcriptional regulator [Bacillus anthracis]KMP80436.1 MarR family transcriptional regulator [Bacillus cereus]KXY66329.1 MarR family transcriptional regulator [Bacillus cereus]
MELKECINFLLSVSQNKVFKYFSKLLEEYGLTPAQYGVLNCLWREGQLSPKQIGELVYLEAPTVSGILDKMQKADLIERSVDPKNRRNVLVVATQKSTEIRDKVEAATIKLNNTVLQNLSDSDKVVLKKALDIIIKSNF